MSTLFVAVDEAANFKKTYKTFYNKHRKHRFYEQNSNWIPKIIVFLMTILVWIFGSLVAIESPSTLTLGGLVIVMDVVSRFGKAGRYIVKAVFNINRAEVAMMRITRILNIPSARGQDIIRIAMQHEQAAESQKLAHSARLANEKLTLMRYSSTRADHIKDAFTSRGQHNHKLLLQNQAGMDKIDLTKCSFSAFSGEEKVSMFSMTLLLNRCYRTVNRDTEFANTSLFMRMCGGQLQPSTGMVSIPPHISIRVLSPTPMLSDAANLIENLRMGLNLAELEHHVKVSDDAIFDLAEKFGMSRALRKTPTMEIGYQGCLLRAKDCTSVQLTRAILSNPQVLFVAKPAVMTPLVHQNRLIHHLFHWHDNDGFDELTALGFPMHSRTLIIQDLDTSSNLTHTAVFPDGSEHEWDYDATIVLENGTVRWEDETANTVHAMEMNEGEWDHESSGAASPKDNMNAGAAIRSAAFRAGMATRAATKPRAP